MDRKGKTATSAEWRNKRSILKKPDSREKEPPGLVKSLSVNEMDKLNGMSGDLVTLTLDTEFLSSTEKLRQAVEEHGGIFLKHVKPQHRPELVSTMRSLSSHITKIYLEKSSILTTGHTDSFVRALESLTVLEEFSIKDSDVFDKLANQMLAAAAKMRMLRKLSFVRAGCTKGISEALRHLCQTSLSLESLIIREEHVTEQYFSWTIDSALGEMRTSVSFYLAQNRALRRICRGGISPTGQSMALAAAAVHTNPGALALNARRLGELPESLFQSEHATHVLTKLDLSNNALCSLSDAVGSLEALTYLDVSCNQLSGLPQNLLRLRELQHLNVSHNELLELSEGLGFLKNLSYLNVASNRLRLLPWSLACLPRLREVLFQDPRHPTNRFSFPAEVQEGGSLSILTHLKYHLKHTRPYGIAPVFVIGHDVSGKNRLVQILAHGNDISSSRSLSSANRHKSSGSDLTPRHFLGRRKMSHPFASGSGSSLTDTASSDSTDAVDGDCFVDTSLFRFTRARSEIRESSPVPVSPTSSSNNMNSSSSGSNNSSAGGSRRPSPSSIKEDISIEVWDFSGHDLIPLYQRETSAFICVINVSSERFSASMVVKMVQRVKLYPTTRVLVVGAYTEGSSGSRLQYVEAELERVMVALPNVICGKVLIALKGESKVMRKQVREAVTHLTAPCPLLNDEVPNLWVVFSKMLRVLGEVLTVPVLTWDELRQHCLNCSIPASDIKAVCQFLESTGHVIFSERVEEDWCVISPSWMATMWSPLRVLQTKPEHRGIVSADELVQAWKSMSCPTWATRPWVALLRRLKMVLPLPKQRLLVVPYLLSRERHHDMDSSCWPNRLGAEQMQYSRVYRLPEPVVDEVFFSQLIVRLLRANWKPLCVWRSGLCLQSESDETVLIEGSASSMAIKLHVRANGVSAELISVIFSLNNVLGEHVSGTIMEEVPCIHCIKEHSYDPYMFTRAELEDAVADGKGVVYCRSVNPILIHSVAPDISMAGIAGHTIEYKDLSDLELVGEGGFAKVYRATWLGGAVAVKKLLPLRGTGADEERRALFSEFRREAWLMSGLEHPNLVILQGVCLEPFCIIMEYMNAGTLHALLHNKGIESLPYALTVKLALDVSKGMEFLHGITPPIVHRDLKSPNILLHALTDEHTVTLSSFGMETRSLSVLPGNVSHLCAKVSDFGLSTETELAMSELSGNVIDNPTWTAPEMLAKQKYTGKVDVYSFGVILWEMLTRRIFFGEINFMSQLEEKIRAGERPPIPSECPLPYKLLIETCWSHDAFKRPSFVEVRKVLQKMALDLGVEVLRTASSGLRSIETAGSGRRRSLSMGGPMLPSSKANVVTAEQQFAAEFTDPQVLAPKHESSVTALAVVEPHLWSGSSHGELFVWDLRTHVLIHQYQAAVPKDADSSMSRRPAVTAIHSLTHTVWTGHSDGSLNVWSRDLKALKHPKKHADSVTFIGSEGSETVITAGMGGSVRRWNIHNFKFSSIEMGIPIICMVQMGVNFVIGSGTDVYLLFPDKTWYCAPRQHTAAIHDVVVVRDMVWTSSSDKSIRMWRLGDTARTLEPLQQVLNGHSSRVFCLAVDPLADYAFSGSWDTAVMMWDVSQLKFVGRIKSEHSDAVSQLAYVVVDGVEYLVSAALDKQVIMYRRRPRDSNDKGLAPEEIALQKEIASYKMRRRLLERRNSMDLVKGEDGPPAPAATEDLRYLDLLTPAERQYVLSMKGGGTSNHRGSAAVWNRRGSTIDDFARSSSGGLLHSPTTGGSGQTMSPSRRRSMYQRRGESDMTRMSRSFSVENSDSGSGSNITPERNFSGPGSEGSSASVSRNSRTSTSGRTSPRATEALSPTKSVFMARPRSRTMGDAGRSVILPIPVQAQAEAVSSPSPGSAPPAKPKPLAKLRGLFRRNSSADVMTNKRTSVELTAEDLTSLGVFPGKKILDSSVGSSAPSSPRSRASSEFRTPPLDQSRGAFNMSSDESAESEEKIVYSSYDP